jgi:hypothetical protein
MTTMYIQHCAVAEVATNECILCCRTTNRCEQLMAESILFHFACTASAPSSTEAAMNHQQHIAHC